LKQLFPLRTCNLNLSKRNIEAKKFKVCLEYHLGNCLGPCEALQSEDDYNLTIDQLSSILKGNYASVGRYLKQEMKKHADSYAFEKAHLFKEKLDILQHYQSKSTIVNVSINNVDIFAMVAEEKYAIVSYLKVINGTIIQTRLVELKKKLDETEEELLLFAVTDIREKCNSNSEEIIVPINISYPNKSIKITVPQIGDKHKLLMLAQKNAAYYKKQKEVRSSLQKSAQERNFEVLQLMKKEFRLKELPRHIECFDNSNFQGTNPTASMVLFRDGKPSKREYRHYKIKSVIGANDFASMEEVVYRRYKRLLEEKQPLPQLVIVDGGKGQLSSALKALEELNLRGKLAIVGIAKRLEEIYVPDDPLPLYIDKKSPSLILAQQLRNEAHRFAITYHRHLRSKGNFESEFQKIPGIGPASVEALLIHFKDANKIKTATIEELEKVVNKKKAKAIFDYYNA